jgi:general secretion pathway protein C
MGRTLSWLANTVLFVLCCFFVADTANAVFATLLTPTPVEAATTGAPALPSHRSWNDRQVILSRNLFNASILAPTTAIALVEENLEATRLPLKLRATAAASDPELSVAVVEMLDSGKTKLVRVGEEVGTNAPVMRIERRRIVLSENGAPRELVLEKPGGEPELRQTSRRTRSARSARSSPRSSRSSRSSRSARRSAAPAERAPDSRIERLAQDRFSVQRSQIDEVVRNPSALLSQASITPEYNDDGGMLGLKVRAIKPGSVFEQVGIENDDVIVEFNGVAIDGPEQMAQVMKDLGSSDELNFVLEGGRRVNFVVPRD